MRHSKFLKMFLVSSVAPLAMAGHALAQESDDTDQAEVVVVFGQDFTSDDGSTGTKTNTPLIETPQSLSVVSRDLLDSWNARKMTEALRYTPGAQAEPFGLEPRFTSLRFRGFDSTSSGLFRDGLILLNPFFLVSYNLEPFGAERVELPRGPASVLYGQGSPGGILNYISRTPTTDALYGEVGVVAGNHNRIEGQFDINVPLGEQVAGRLTALYRDSETQVDFLPEDRQFIAGALKWELADRTDLTFLANFQQDDAMNSQALPADGTVLPNPNGVVPFNRFTGEPSLDVVDRTEYSAMAMLEHEFSDDVNIVSKVRFNDVDLDDIVVYSLGLDADQRTIQRGAFASFGRLSALTADNQLHWRFDTGGMEHQLLLGMDFIDAEGDQSQQFNGAAPSLDIFDPVYGVDIPLPAPFVLNDITMKQVGFYAQDQIKLTDKLIFNGAVRYTDVESETFSRLSNSITQSADDTAWTYRAGLVYRSDADIAPYINYAESFLPSLGTDSNGVPFEPEEGKLVEVGVKYQPRGHNGFYTLAIFDLDRKDIVLRDPSFVLFQAGLYNSQGLEAEAFVSLDNGLSVTASYTYLQTEIKDHPNPALIGKEFTQIPEHKVAMWGDYSFSGPLQGVGGGLGVRYQSETFSNDANTIQNDGFTLADAAIHYEWDRYRLALNVQNLFDERYTASCFQRNSLLCSFGEGRALRASLTYRFGDRPS